MADSASFGYRRHCDTKGEGRLSYKSQHQKDQDDRFRNSGLVETARFYPDEEGRHGIERSLEETEVVRVAWELVHLAEDRLDEGYDRSEVGHLF